MKKLLLLSIFAIIGIANHAYSQNCGTAVQNLTEDFNTLPDPNNLGVLPECWSVSGGSAQMDSNGILLALLGNSNPGTLITPDVENGAGTITFKARKASSYTVYLSVGYYNGGFVEAVTYTLGGSYQTYTYDFANYHSTIETQTNIAFKITSGPNAGVQRLLLDDVQYKSFCQPAATPTALAKDITIKLDATGNAIANPADVDNSSTDDCGEFITNFSLDKTLFTCDDIGINAVTLTATDSEGQTATATANITVEPNFVFNSNQIALDENGEANIDLEFHTQSKTDCEAVTYAFEQSTFTCEDAGYVLLTVIATYDGMTSTFTKTKTLSDYSSPVAIAQDISVDIDENTGLAIVTPEMVDDGSSDNCGITSMTLSQTSFDCGDQGENEVTLTVTDAAGRTATAAAVVTINSYLDEFELTTSSSTVCFDGSNETSGVTIDLSGSTVGTQYYLRKDADSAVVDGPIDGTGSALSFDAGAITENTTFHVYGKVPFSGSALDLSAGGAHLSVNTPGAFDYSLGYTISAWVKLGASGNSTFYNGIFYVGGATGSDIEMYENSSGTITVLHNRGNGGTQGAYSISGNPITNNTYVHVALTYNGLASRVFVNGTEVGAASLIAPTKSASSEMTFGHMNSSAFPAAQRYDGLMDDIRVYDKALTAEEILTDYDKCISGTEDNLALYFDLESASGSIYTDLVSSTPAQVKNGGTTTNDGAISCSFTCNRIMADKITIGDGVAPTVLTKDITLDYTGTAIEITAADIDNGSSDNCTANEILSFEASQTTFTCNDLGTHTVTLTVTDEAGNSQTAEATVTVNSSIDNSVLTASTANLCPADTEGLTLSLSNSIEGIEYYLKNNSDNIIVDGPIAGNSGTIDFTANNLTETSTFAVLAKSEPQSGFALEFDGQNDYVDAGTDSRGITNQITMGAWVNTTFSGATNFVAQKYDGARGYLLFISATGTVKFDGRDGVNIYRSSGESTTTVNDGTWHYILGTADISTGDWKIYIDGVLENSSENTAGSSLNPTSRALVVGAYGTAYYSGQMDDVAVWNTVLDDETIANHSAKCAEIEIDNTVAFFDFNEGAGLSAADQSPGQVNGTLTNVDETAIWIADAGNTGCPTCELELSSIVEVTVGDMEAPTVVTQDISIVLDANGNATIAPTDIDNGSSDNCTDVGSLTLSLDITSFGIDDLGENTVTLSVEDANGNSATGTSVVTVSDKEIQNATITGVADKTFGDADFAISTSVNSELDVTYTVSSGGLSIVSTDGSMAIFTITGTGTATVEVSNAGNATYAPLQETITITIAKADQTLTMEQVQDKSQAASSFDIVASVDTDLELIYAVSGPATISGSTVTLTGTLGSVTVTVSQAGTDNYNAASASVSFEVIEKLTQTISFADLSALTYGASAQTLSATASSGLEVIYSVISGPVSIDGNAMTITGAGEATIEANQVGDEDFAAADAVQKTFTIAQAPLQVSADDFTITYGDAVPTLTFSYSGFVNGETSANLDAEPTIEANTGVIKGALSAGVYDIILSGGSAANYVFAYVNGILTVVKTDQTVSIEPIEDKLTTDESFDLVATATSGLELTFEITGPASLSGTTVALDGTPGTVTITATQAGSNNHNAASASISFEVNAPLSNENIEAAVEVYPNPASSYLNIKANNFIQSKIYGLDGTLKIATDKMDEIDIEQLPSGIYLIEIELKEKTVMQKLVIQN